MGFDKLAAIWEDQAILAHTVAIFMRCELITEIILVAPPERMSLLDSLVFTKPLQRVDGGSERHFSVMAGLKAVSASAEYIAIHDAARPFVSDQDVVSVIQAAETYHAATLARKVTETLKRSDDSDFIETSVERDALWFIETPQVFRADLILKAYQYVISRGLIVTDESSALQFIHQKTKLIPSTSPNPKITTPSDLKK